MRLESGYWEGEKAIAVARLLHMSSLRRTLQASNEQDTHCFKPLTLNSRERFHASISVICRQKVVSVGDVVAENHTASGKVEDGNASGEDRVVTIPVAGDRRV